jgi:hypothetical protein
VTPDERELMAILCQRIAVEQDRMKFTKLVAELNELLEKKEHRLEDRDSLAERKAKLPAPKDRIS